MHTGTSIGQGKMMRLGLPELRQPGGWSWEPDRGHEAWVGLLFPHSGPLPGLSSSPPVQAFLPLSPCLLVFPVSLFLGHPFPSVPTAPSAVLI